jgi:nucleotide-binding universal stress UspA family protein
MNRTPELPVIVGFDGSTAAYAAVRYGADEAWLRGCALQLVNAFSWPLLYPLFGAVDDPGEQNLRLRMLGLLAGNARELRRDRPGLSVATRTFDGSPGGVLIAASRDAALLVVGHRGMGGFAGLLAGSVGIQAAGHAHCPVLVVRGEAVSADAPVVLGVDGSPAAGSAADEAFAHAGRRAAELLAVHSVPRHSVPRHAVPAGAVPVGGRGGREPAPDDFAAGLHAVADRHDEVSYRTEVIPGDSAATTLIAVAHRARAGLIVVGSRGVGGFRGLVMGSTSRALIEHAPCPVMVVPGAQSEPAPGS